jgi:HSP20 family molecular chaperone IbpA
LGRPLFSKHAPASHAVLAALAEAERVIVKTRCDALELFRARGVIDRAALTRWLNGAHDACWRIRDIVERDDSFVISIELPTPHDGPMELTREPRRLVIRTRDRADGVTPKVLRRLDLPIDLSSERVEAELREDALVIRVPKSLR